MKRIADLLTLRAEDATTAVYALALHALALVLVAGAGAGLRPELLARGRRRAFFLTVQPIAAVLAGFLQVYAAARVPELNPPDPLAHHYRIVFFAVPYILHVAAFAVCLSRCALPPSTALQADYTDTDPVRQRDVTPPEVRRSPQPSSDLADPPAAGRIADSVDGALD